MSINGHDSMQPDLSTVPAREAWGKEHGLPTGFVILSNAEMEYFLPVATTPSPAPQSANA